MSTSPATQQNPASQLATVKGLLSMDSYKKRFEEVLGKKAPSFIASITNAAQMPHLAECEPKSVIASAFIAATLDLPIDKNLGFAHLVPYKAGGGRAICQFQMGYKGFMQLAFRTGQYRQFNDAIIPEGVFQSYNELTGDLVLDWSKASSEKAAGYACFFRTANGFEKTVYWSRAKVFEHAKRYSKSFGRASSPWQTQFDAMALKTVIKYTLAKYGLLSVEMQNALVHDQGSQSDIDSTVEHVDGTNLFDNATEVETVAPVSDGVPDDFKDLPQPAGDVAFDREKIIAELKNSLLDHNVSEPKLFDYAKRAKLVPQGVDELFSLPTDILAKLRFAVPTQGTKGGAK